MTEGTEDPQPPARPPLDLDDVVLVPEQTLDDTDSGWGSESRADEDPVTVLRRYLDDKPPHHGD